MLSKDVSSISGLFGDIVQQLSNLVGTEVRLAQAEASEKISEAVSGLAFVAVAGVLLIPAISVALAALALWISQMGVTAPLAFLISAVFGAILSAVFLIVGLGRLKLKRFKLQKTSEQLSQDIAAARRLAR